MAKNNRKGFGVFFPALVLLTVVAAVIYTFGHLHLLKIGYRIRQLENRYAASADENRTLKFKLSSLKAPRNIEREMAKRNLDLRECNDRKIVWLDESPAPSELRSMPETIKGRNGLVSFLFPDSMGNATSKK